METKWGPGRTSSDIVGYTYNAENLCPPCVVKATVKTKTTRDAILGDDPTFDVEGWLDFLAKTQRVDRQDEHSFDSGDFPKVVFNDQLEPDEQCGRCGATL